MVKILEKEVGMVGEFHEKDEFEKPRLVCLRGFEGGNLPYRSTARENTQVKHMIIIMMTMIKYFQNESEFQSVSGLKAVRHAQTRRYTL